MVHCQSITEPARQTPVFLKTDVLVCGGGPAGTAAAIAAARQGVSVTLLERYGCLGGLATGGLVIVLPCFLEDGVQVIGGIGKELRDRLIASGEGALRPGHRSDGSAFDPEAMKRLSVELCQAESVEVLHHVWVAGVVRDGSRVTGVIFESKAGRMAALADVVIDATGDGDVFAAAGAPFESSTQQIGLPFRLIHIDTEAWQSFREREPKRHAEIIKQAHRDGGFTGAFQISPLPLAPGMAWGNNGFLEGDALDIRTLSRVECEGRVGVAHVLRVLRAEMPGFENAVLIDTASQLGVRRSRRLVGEYVITDDDVTGRDTRFPDAVGRGNDFRRGGVVYEIPYRALLPRELDGLLVAGRCLSCTHEALEPLREIHVCWVVGQAAGAAAALAVQGGVSPRSVAPPDLQQVLHEAGVPFGDDSPRTSA